MNSRTALVTGGSRGLGRAIALRLATEGFDVAVVDLEAEAAEQTAVEIRSAGRRCIAFKADVADPEAASSVVDQVVAQWGRIDVLVCNAGIFARSIIIETSDEEFRRTFDVNVGGVFYYLRATLPVMMRQGRGRIVTIASHNYKRGTGASSRATYAATKAAVVSYTKGAAVEAAPYGITVNSVSPGWIETGPPPVERSDLQKQLLAAIPLGRPGKPHEIAAAVAYLVSDDAAYITGEILDVNGGTWMD